MHKYQRLAQYKKIRFLLMLLCLLWSGQSAFAQSNKNSPRVWEAPLVIPTYELGAPNPYPAVLDWQRRKWRPVYPYPMLDSLTNKRTEKTYKAVYLENEYLKVTVLPELGGHLYAIYDKTANRDVLYTNHVVKYAMVGLRGAWVSGGIEWNFPDGHTVTTVSPIDYRTRLEADGSAAVIVGDTERVQGMQWQVIIRLRPNQKIVETEVTLNNRRLVPGRYWYWSTAAAPATDDMRFVYPMREAYPHTFWPVFSFPKEKGVDLSTYREVPNALSLFARNSARDFFGVYYEKSDWGIVHVADHREMPGKKTWTWGTDPAGQIWVDKLTDTDGQYVEFQAGRFETQIDHEFIAPHRIERFTEYWFPVNHLGGGWNEATRDAALRVTMENTGEGKGEGKRVTLNLNANIRTDAELVVEGDGRRIHAEHVSLDPAKPFTTSFEVSAEASSPLSISLIGNDRRRLLSYRTDDPIDGQQNFKPATRPVADPVVADSAEQLYLKGVAADKKSKEQDARSFYRDALKRDSGFSPAQTALGLSYYRSGEYEKASEYLEQALRRDKDGADAHYYLALVRRAQNQMDAARSHLTMLIRSGRREALARYVLGEMDLAANKIDSARENFALANQLDPRDVKTKTMLAMMQRLNGKNEAAQALIESVMTEMPLDYLALREQYLVYQALGQNAKAQGALGELWRLLDREPDSVLELVFDYTNAGRFNDARLILEEAIERAQTRKSRDVSPMIYYTLGYLDERDDRTAQAGEQYRHGAQGDPSFVFPHRVEEIDVLRAAIKTNPKDGHVAYYLGNALASKDRAAEALIAWREALQLDPSNLIARRNYALALWQSAGQKEEAAREYAKAIATAPDDYRLYIEFDRLLKEVGDTDSRIKLLEAAPASVKTHSAFVQTLAAAETDAEKYAEAAKLLAENSFTSGEGEEAVLVTYKRAHLGLARKYQRAGAHAEAAAEFLKATDYPQNLGVGRPAMQSQAREYVFAARELEAANRQPEAQQLWQRAADEPLNAPTQPEETWSEHYYYKAIALEHVGRKAEARALYERLGKLADEQQMLEAEPTPPTGAIRYALAGAGLKALGRTQEARTALENALRIDAANELARSQLLELTNHPANAGHTGRGR